VRTTVKVFVAFHAVADYLAPTMRAFRSHRLDRTLKAIEDMGLACRGYLKCFVIVITTGFTSRHFKVLPSGDIALSCSHDFILPL
jgi:hypothetical protein